MGNTSQVPAAQPESARPGNPEPSSSGPGLASGKQFRLPPQLVTFLQKYSWKHWTLLFLVMVLGYQAWHVFAASQAATLKIQGQHSFRQAEMQVWVDGELIQKYSLSGAARRHFGLPGSVQGSFAKSMKVPAGEHTIRLVFSVPAESYEKENEISGDFESQSERTLYVNAERRSSNPYLAWRDSVSLPKVAAASSLPGYAKVVTSFLFTIGGSMLSAIIGFLVQERLKAFKAKRAARTGS